MVGTSQIHFFPVSGEATWIVDGEGIIVFWNEAATDLFKFKSDEVLGRFCQDIIKGCNCSQHLFCPCYQKGGASLPNQIYPSQFRMRTRCGDGKLRTLQVITHLISLRRDNHDLCVLHTAYPAKNKSVRHGMQIRLLGPVAATRSDGTLVEGQHWRRTKVRALLVVLALEAGRPIHRERLLEVLWAKLDYQPALANLNTTVYHLRRSLCPHEDNHSIHNRIEYESDHYVLHWSGRDWLDTITFQQEIKRARMASRSDVAARHFQGALDLYRGDFVNDVILVYQDDYFLREQERLRSLYLTVLEEYALLEERRGNLSVAEDLYTRILTYDPCDEPVCRQLISLLLRTGNRSRALAHFAQLKEAMQQELDTTPEDKTVRLYEAARLHIKNPNLDR